MEVLLDIIGHPGVGKSSVCKHLKSQWGFEVYSPSKLIRDYASRRGLTPRGRKAFAECHEQMVNEDPLAFIRPILGSNALRLCADGLRAPLDVQNIKHMGGYVVALTGNQEARYTRATLDSTRSGSRVPLSFDDFCAAEMADINSDPRLPNTQAVIDVADFTIPTDYLSTEEVNAEMDTIVRELLNDPTSRTSSYSQ